MRSHVEKFIDRIRLIAGVLINLQLSAIADRSAEPLLLKSCVHFRGVWSHKSDYVEPVSDKN